LNDTIISFDTKNTSQNLIYTGVANVSTYAAMYVKTGPDYLPNYITVGDVIRISFNSSYPIGQGQFVRTKIIPKRGVIVPIDFVTPDVISTQRVNLYP
jgi:archaellin